MFLSAALFLRRLLQENNDVIPETVEIAKKLNSSFIYLKYIVTR